MNTKKKKVCQVCGRDFVRTGNAQKVCKKCGAKKPLIAEKRKCLVCGDEFEVPTTRNGAKRKYCSAECRYKAQRKAAANKIYYSCEWCGKPLPENSTEKYCSEECRNKAKSNSAKKRGRKKKVRSITEIIKLAQAEGLTYGQYVSKYGG